jgi:hypothetical protein
MVTSSFSSRIRCECEHICHLSNLRNSPNGNPGHRHGQSFDIVYVKTIKTEYGTYILCRDCADDCHKQVTLDPQDAAILANTRNWRGADLQCAMNHNYDCDCGKTQ